MASEVKFFETLKLIKTYLRSFMSERGFRGFATVSVGRSYFVFYTYESFFYNI